MTDLNTFNRSLNFTFQALTYEIEEKHENLSDAFAKAYPNTLREYHGLLGKAAFDTGIKWIPPREKFYEKLAGDPVMNATARGASVCLNKEEREKVQEQLKEYLAGLGKVVESLNKIDYPLNEKWVKDKSW